MKAMILAAGLGTRLRPLTEKIPKPLLPVGKYSLLVWNLLLLKRHGICEAMINLHHLGDQIVEAIGDGSRYGMRLAYSHEPELLGSGGGIKQATPYLQNDTFLVLNGDTLSNCDLAALIGTHRASGALATLAVREDPHAADWGAILVDERSRIVQIKGQPAGTDESTTELHPHMFAGLHVLEPTVLEAIPPKPCSIIDVYIDLLRQARPLAGHRLSGYWSDIGTPERYEAAQQDVADGRLNEKWGRSQFIHDSANRENQ
jgi:NDP-sugar pyrophosphorylase family protein